MASVALRPIRRESSVSNRYINFSIILFSAKAKTNSFSASGNIVKLEVNEGTSTFPQYTATLKATGEEARGDFKCSVQVGDIGTKFSNVWNNSFGLIPSIVFLVLSIFAAFRFQ